MSDIYPYIREDEPIVWLRFTRQRTKVTHRGYVTNTQYRISGDEVFPCREADAPFFLQAARGHSYFQKAKKPEGWEFPTPPQRIQSMPLDPDAPLPLTREQKIYERVGTAEARREAARLEALTQLANEKELDVLQADMPTGTPEAIKSEDTIKPGPRMGTAAKRSEKGK